MLVKRAPLRAEAWPTQVVKKGTAMHPKKGKIERGHLLWHRPECDISN